VTPSPRPLAEIDVAGMAIARARAEELLDHVFRSLDAGRGGWIVTANLDMLRRHRKDPHARSLYDAADVRVADGMPLVWASRIAGEPSLPERIAGSTLTEDLVARAAHEGRSVFLLGGAPGTAERAARTLAARYGDAVVAGFASPDVSSPATVTEVSAIADALRDSRPSIVLVGLGSPKQEHLIHALRDLLRDAWMIGVGVTFSFVSGEVSRAPRWMQRAGLEWAHRMAMEPRRLARRYLVDDLPFAFVLFSESIARRFRA
jgi:N-acetylglucosaminyldiphosphoundecaprenol N-acetyl-beta-D-mannosaminyltransferase